MKMTLFGLYVGTKPTERNTDETSELLDPAVYVKGSSIDGNEVTFAALGENDQAKYITCLIISH